MLFYLVAFAAVQAPAANAPAASAPATSAAPAQLVAPKPEKKKKKRKKYVCTGTEAMTGSYLIPCEPDEAERNLQNKKNSAAVQIDPR